MENERLQYWLPDVDTYNDIQELIPFVDFLVSLPETTPKQKQIAEEIKVMIRRLKDYKGEKSWCACISVRMPDNYPKPDGYFTFSRDWWVFFEQDRLSIEIETRNTEHPGHYGDDFWFWGCVDFTKEKQRNVYLAKSIRYFTEDAMNYKKYMSEVLSEIEVDIDF